MKTALKHRKTKGFTSIILCLSVFFLFANNLTADNSVTSGTTVRVVAGTTLVSTANLTLKNGSALANLGTVVLNGNLNNQNASPSTLGAGTISMSGSVAQTITGPNIFGNLTLNNAAGVILNASATVNGALTFTNGRITLGSNNLLLGTAATIGGAPSASSMVVATETGELRKSFSAAGNFSFPVGDNSGTAEYTPVTVNFTGGSFGGGNYVGVKVTNSPYPGAAGSYLNRYWGVTQSGISGFTCNATLKYMPADVIGTEILIYCVRIIPTAVDYFSVTNPATDILTANGLTQFGTFTGIQQLTNKTLNLTALLEGLYNGAGTMKKAKNATGDQYTGNTADQISIELHNSTIYAIKTYTVNNVNLSTTGASSITVPGIYSGSYYVTLRHRNSIETTTAAAVSFAGGTINYNFDGPIKAYGGNLLLMADGRYTIYGGDVNQNGSVDISDMTPVDNGASNFVTGYLATDVNGDGTIDTADMTIVDNNSSSFVSAATP